MSTNYKTMPTPLLWAELKACFAHAAQAIDKAAKIWVELENRGEDMSPIRTPFLSLLPDVASGTLPAELVLRYAHDIQFLEAARDLVEEDQAKLLQPGFTLDVVTVSPEGQYETRTARPIDLRASEVDVVFGDGRIRTVAEQKRILRPRKAALSQAYSDVPSTLDADDFDLWLSLAPAQRQRLFEVASSKNMSVSTFIVDLLIRNNVISKSRAKTAAYA